MIPTHENPQAVRQNGPGAKSILDCGLARMNSDRKNSSPGPRFIRIGSRAIRYLRENLDAWPDQWRNGWTA